MGKEIHDGLGAYGNEESHLVMTLTLKFIIVSATALGLLSLSAFLVIVFLRKLKGKRSLSAEKLLKRYEGLSRSILTESPERRDETLRRIRKIGDPQLVERFLDSVSSVNKLPPGRLRHYYDALGITDRYLDQLKHSGSWKRRASAAEKLGKIGSAKAVPALLSVVQDVKDEDEDVRGAALRALGRIRDESSVPFLVEALGFPETWLPPRIAEVLVNIGDPVVTRLVKELKESHNETRRVWAAEILGCLEAKTALMPLIDALSDISPEVRAKAAAGLGKLSDDRAVGKLLELLVSEPVAFVRVKASQALGAIGNPAVIDYLVNTLKDPEWWVRMRAVEALEHLGAKAVPALLGALEDEDPEVRKRSAMALERSGYVDRLLEEYAQEKYRPEIRKILFLVAKTGVVESISEKLHASELHLQKNIVRLLGEAEVQEASEPLMELLESTTDWSLKARIIQSLGRIKARSAVPVLVASLKDSKYWVRNSAVEALGRLKAKEAAGLIAEILEDPSPRARQSALTALWRLKAVEYRDGFVRLLNDPSPGLRAQAIQVLREMGLSFDRVKGIGLLKDPFEPARTEAVRYFTAVRERGLLTEMIRLLPSASPELRQEIVRYVQTVKPESFQEILQPLEGKELSIEVQCALVHMASSLGDEQSSKFVLSCTKHEDPIIRASAYQELPRISSSLYDGLWEKGISDPAAEVRVNALTCLGPDLDSRALEKAKAVLNDPDPDVRTALAFCLGASSHLEFKETLKSMLQDSSQRVVAGALIGLASLDDVGFLQWLASEKDLKAIRKEVRKMGQDPRYQGVIERIRGHTRFSGNLEIEFLLAKDERHFAQRLFSSLKSTLDPDHRAQAMEILKLVATEEWFVTVLSILKKDPSEEVRIKAMEILVNMGRDDEAIGALSFMLLDPSLQVRIRAAELLSEYKKPSALETLLKALDTSDRQFRESVTTSLSKILIQEPDRVGDLIREIPETKTRKLGMAWLMGKTRKSGAMKFLRTLLEDPDPDVRAAAVGALGKFKRRPLLRYLEKLIRDPNERVRAATVNAIYTIGGEKAFGLIEQALVDIDPFVRKRAAVGLAKIDGEKAVAVLQKKSEGMPELSSCLKGVACAVGLSYPASLQRDPVAKNILEELCPEKEMLAKLESSSSETERLHALRVLTLVHRPGVRRLARLAGKDPSLEVREEAKKLMAT